MKALIILILTLFGTDSFLRLPNSVITEVQNNIIAYRLNNGYLGVDQYSNLELKDPIFDHYLLQEDQKLNLDYYKSTEMAYPISGYDIYVFSNLNCSIITKDSIITEVTYSDRSMNNQIFLVAYNSDDQKMKFLGGEFYRSIIGPDFMSFENPIKEVLTLKYFHLNLRDVRCKKKRKNYLIYEAYSNSRNANIEFKIDREYIDRIEILD